MITFPANFKKTGVLYTHGPLKVVLFKNPSGTTVFRVTGTVLGQQVKKNFRTLDEAVASLEPIFREMTGGMSASDLTELHVVRTSLTHEQVTEAEEGFRRLRGLGLKLLEALEIAGKYVAEKAAVRPDASGYLRAGLESLGFGAEPKRKDKETKEEFEERQAIAKSEQKLLANANEAELAVAHYARTLTARNVLAGTVDVYRYVVADFIRTAAIATVAEISYEKLLAYITRAGVSTRTQKDQRARLFGFCRHLEKAKLLTDNPVARIDPIRQKRKAIVYATVLQAAATLELFARSAMPRGRRVRGTTANYVQPPRGAMLPRYLLTAFGPLRPDEISRLSPDWGNFNFERHTVQVVRTKSGGENITVDLDPRLSGVLRECATRGLQPNFRSRKAWEAWLKQGGIPQRVRDVLRHTYATYSYSTDANKHELARRMNNSTGVLERHYINTAASEADGHAYFGLLDRVIRLLELPEMPGSAAGAEGAPNSQKIFQPGGREANGPSGSMC